MNSTPDQESSPNITPRPRKKTSGFVIFLIILGVVVVFFVILGLIVKSSISGFEASLGGKGSELTEKVLIKGEGEDPGKIALITLHGVIKGSGSEIQGDGALYELSRRLHKAAEDEDIKAVLFQVNSPGGGLAASNIIHNQVMNIKKAGKPVVVWISGLAASGGLYVSAPADWIIASPTALVGSIGVIMQHLLVKELCEKIGVKVKPIKSTHMKDIGSPFRDMTKEEEQYFKRLIDNFHDHFVNIIVEGRGLDETKVREMASGKIFTAEESKEYGLIDDIGFFEDAMTKIKELTGLESPYVVKYKEPLDIESLFSKFPFGSSMSRIEETKLLLQAALDMAATPEVRVIWQVDN